MVVEQAQDVTYILADLNSRVRTLESKYNLLGERLLVVNKNMIEEYKKLMKELRAMTSYIRGLKAEIEEAKQVVKSVVGELDGMARKEDVKVIEKYLKLWSPLNFVTDHQLEQALDEKLGRGRPSD